MRSLGSLVKVPGRVTTFGGRSRKNIATHFLIVKGKSAGRPVNVRYLYEGLGPWPGTSVWTLRVTLGQHLVQGRKYHIEATCTGRGRFNFRAYGAEHIEKTLELTSEKLLAEK